jgi:hypothetical protein
VSGLRRVAYCGRFLHGGSDFATVVLGDSGVAGWGGLQTCGSVWACPVCSATIRQARGCEVERAATGHLAEAGTLAFATFTLPHTRDLPLRQVLGELRDAFGTLRRGRSWRRLLAGYVAAVEITHGLNGWHPHLHVLLFLPAGAGMPDLTEAWCDAVEKHAGRRPSAEHGARIQPVSAGGGAALATYLTKVQDGYGAASSIHLEMARGDLKRGRRHSRTPFELLEAAAAGDARAHALWREYEDATKGRRCMTWSTGLRDRFAEDDGALAVPDGEAVAALSRDEYALVVEHGQTAVVLDVAERAREAGGDPGAAVYAAVRALVRRQAWDRQRRRRQVARAAAGGVGA